MGGVCLIGGSLKHTVSPMIHAAFGREEYGVRELKDKNELERFVKSRECRGYNVTIPYKQLVMPLLDELSDEAREAGAVNTVIDIGGRLIGDNTDIAGMRYALNRAGISLQGKNVLVLGSGGTSHTARYLAAKEGAKSVSIVSRTGEINYQNCYGLKDTQMIINATPVGMAPDCYHSPIDPSRFPALEGVFDAIYNPLETLLVKKARELGVKAANGLNMLVEQARIAHNLFCSACGGDPVDESASEGVRKMIEAKMRGVTLIGMAGAGKTTVGRALAKALGREFADTDELVERRAGKSIPAIFAEEGEQKFRQYEAQAVKDSCLNAAVVATGGGAVMSEENAFYMGASSVVVYVMRDVASLAREGRPLSTDDDRVRALFEARKSVYEREADISVSNDGDIAETIGNILKELKK